MIRIYTLIATLQSFVNDRFEDRKDRGATAVEYGLLVGLIAVAIIAAVLTLGGDLKGLFEKVSKSLQSIGGTGTN
ncbi:Flp family type IVb pilin [Enteractinococcus coprophilus]|uniref:Pilus assembly protein Flp/PilA n=1 Tax=Enteractinococcus coprophilus TaxID=1027633 RepID=A0A543AGD9_9MICC|nr:Flp family type IVb pilin [Enteractinococcus coprophilus]TQL71648.1 pilus assembly protein Flp/PilA [Enteractinococcus coprophilus]